MRSIVCMFDSGYTLPQGREVINYYYPLEYGFDALIQMAREKESGSRGPRRWRRLGRHEPALQLRSGHPGSGRHTALDPELRERSAPPGGVRDLSLQQKREYQEIAQRLESVAHNKPTNFCEAIQMIWTIHVAVLNEDAISGLSPGRVGQVLYPYYEHDKAAGRITDDEVLEWLELQRVKFTCIDCFASAGCCRRSALRQHLQQSQPRRPYERRPRRPRTIWKS